MPDEEPTEPEASPSSPAPEESPVAPLLRVAVRFMIPFLFSWAVAYVGSQSGREWLYFVGLGGVTISMLGLMIWLIH